MPALRPGLIMLTLLITACGFQLQQPTEFPPEMAQMQLKVVDPYGVFGRKLQNLLEQGGVALVEEDSALSVLSVPVNQVRKEILTIGDNARVREYRLRHTVAFVLTDPEGQPLVPEQRLEQVRVISFDEADILGAAQEDEQMRREMAETLARLLIRRLGTTRATP